MKPILGLDLGTTKCVACVRLGNDFVEISPVSGRFGGKKILPSVFVHLPSGKPVVGEDADSEYGADPEFRGQVIRNVKRSMKHNFPEANRTARKFRSGNRDFTPAEISGHFLRVLREAAERETDRLKALPSASGLDWSNWLDEVVITVPAYFSPVERRATRQAASLAGFPDAGIHLLDEPVAAALSERIHEQTKSARILVVDLGGGTCDLTLLETGAKGFRELGRFGDNEFGGLEWDLEIAKLVALRKYRLPGVSHLLDDYATPDYYRFGELFKESETAKIDFGQNGTLTQVKVLVKNPDRPGITGEPVPLTRQEFDEISNELAEYCGQLADRLLESVFSKEPKLNRDERGTWGQVDEVLLVGGGSQLTSVREALQRRLGKPLRIPAGAQLSVARGAAMYGHVRSRGEKLEGISHPRCPQDVGILVTPVPPKQSVWQKLFRAGTKPAKQNGKPVTGPAPVFRPLIARNTELPLPEGVLYEFPLDNDRARRMVLDVCFLQCTRQMPEGVVRVLRTVRFSGLRRSADPSRDRLEVLLKYDEDYELRVTANIRDGDHHDPVTVTIHMDDFGGGERSTSALK